jgi:hypothetical protein
MEVKTLLGKHIDVTKNDGFHVYAVLKDIEQHGIWVEFNSELIFIAFTNLKEIRLDRRYKEAF